MLELILVLFIWLFVAYGLWSIASFTSQGKRERQIDFILCLFWPVSLPLALIVVVFWRP